MAEETIYYKVRTGVKTKDPLRELNLQDQTWLRTVLLGYKTLAEIDPRPGFNQWFNMANASLPVQPQNNNQRNSPESFCQGMIDKLNQSPTRRDLSPKQCDALTELSKQMASLYNDQIPCISFKEKVLAQVPASQVNFKKLFRQFNH